MDNQNVLKNVVDLSLAAVEVSVSTTNILSGTRDVQKAATSMASAIGELSASIGVIEQSAQRTTGTVLESGKVTRAGVDEMTALKGSIGDTGKVFNLVLDKTGELQTIVASLGEVIDLISKIARQTKLLALNAMIEAARAHEHGKGFAVVATEVKSLSTQTSDATGKIQQQIDRLSGCFAEVLQSVSKAQETVRMVGDQAEKVVQGFDEISGNTGAITGQVNELASVITQQKAAVDLLAQNMSVVAGKADGNLDACGKLTEQADQSVKIIEDWRSKLASEDIPGKVILLAQADHLLWKKRLLDRAVGRSNLKSSELTDHTMCRLGKWYYGDGDAEIKSKAVFLAIEEPHKKVHYHGIEAAKCFESGQIDAGMRHFAQLEAASAEVIKNLKALTDEH